MEFLADIASERAVLAGLMQYGHDCFIDVDDVLDQESFSCNENLAIYKCIKHHFAQSTNPLDYPSIFAAAKELNLMPLLDTTDNKKYINGIKNFPIKQENVRKLAIKIRKLYIARLLYDQLEDCQNDIASINGTETISQITGLAESKIFEFASKIIDSNNNESVLIGDGLREYIEHIKNDPKDILGISTGFPLFDIAIGGGLRRGTVNLVGARAKCLEIHSLVYTIDGPKQIKDIKIGDILCHPNGGTTKVRWVGDIETKESCEILLSDKTKIIACRDHLWLVYKRYPNKNKDRYIKMTKDLKYDLLLNNSNKKEYKWDIHLTKPVFFNKKEVPLDPYVLGILIGDGSFGNSITLTSGDQEIFNELFIRLPNYEIKLDATSDNAKTYRINGLQNIIRSLNLFKVRAKNKFIPDIYKYNDISIRLNILQGLMDTDGTCYNENKDKNQTSRSSFCSTSKKLAMDVKEIVESLGGLCHLNKNITQYNDKPYIYYRCEITLKDFELFKLKRKNDRNHGRINKDIKKTIVNITKTKPQQVRCIQVDNPDGLFLTNNFTITHNCGKTTFGINVALHVAGKLNIPVLMLDTEMNINDHRHKSLGYYSEVSINEIETGKFTTNRQKLKKIDDSVTYIETIPYTYQCIAGMNFDEVLSIARRWITKNVGYNSNGTVKDCLIVYDYLKLMTGEGLKDMQEYQMLGFQMTNLHNFTVKYDVPCLTFIQLNRDGITKETADVAAQSDRLVWFCSNFSLFKHKSDEEIAEEGIENGNRKLIPLVCRHGKGLEPGDYINMELNGNIAKIVEKQTRYQLHSNKKKEGFEDKQENVDVAY